MGATGPLATEAGSGYEIATATPGAAAIANLPLVAASTRPLAGRWSARIAPAEEATLRSTSEGLLLGTVTNPLAVELSDAWLFHQHWAYSLGRLPAGGSAILDASGAPENLKWRLTRRTIQQLREVTSPWDPTGAEIPRILEIMMFHQAAGGRTYTRLSSDTTRWLDMSDLLQYDRAVLWGRAEQPAMNLSLGDVSGAPARRQHEVVYRVVLPVIPPEGQTDSVAP
jgi:hypothetical protein